MRLYIDTVEIPFDSSQSIALNWSAESLCDLQSARSGARITLRIAATPQSDRVLLQSNEPEAAQPFNASYHTARLGYQGVTLIEGRCVVVGVEQIDEHREYIVEINAAGAEWAKQAARSKLDALPMEFHMELIPSEIVKSWSDEVVKFLPVVRDSYKIEASESALIPAEKILSTDDYHPFVSVAALLRAIVQSGGYTLEGDFLNGSLFKSLMLSGGYAQSDTAAIAEKMAFHAERTEAVEAQADQTGRVWFSPEMEVASVGNIVDNISDGECYSRGGYLRMEDSALLFRPPTTVQAGFIYKIRYESDYRIATRERLTGFDTIYIPSTGEIHFELANRFEDRRNAMSSNFSYNVVVFGHQSGQRYKLSCSTPNGEYVMGQFASRSATVQTSTATWYREPRLYRLVGSVWVEYGGDWALYDGYITETGRSEVSISIRTTSCELSPSAPERFDGIYMSGAEPGMTLSILGGTSIEPCFHSTAGYGANLTFADIMHNGMSQAELMEQVRRMFNMRIYTDTVNRTVYIAPEERFYGKKSFDWSDRIDYSKPIVRSDRSIQAHDTLQLGYNTLDGEARRYNAANDTTLGEWTTRTGRYGSIEGVERIRCDMLSPTLSLGGQYANAESAMIMSLGDRDDLSTSVEYVSPRIVRWLGMRSLPQGERWGYPAKINQYPLAAFHLPPQSVDVQGYTLCFENRDGVVGLHTHYDAYAQRAMNGHTLSIYMHIDPDTWASLWDLTSQSEDIASIYYLTIDGHRAPYILRSIEDYDPRKSSVKCKFDSW